MTIITQKRNDYVCGKKPTKSPIDNPLVRDKADGTYRSPLLSQETTYEKALAKNIRKNFPSKSGRPGSKNRRLKT